MGSTSYRNVGKGLVRICTSSGIRKSTLEKACVELEVTTEESHPEAKWQATTLPPSKDAESAKLCKIQGWDQEKLHKSPSILHPQPVKHQKTPTNTKSCRCKKCGKHSARPFI